MSKKTLLEEAIAEAKQVREAAIHNAVKQLEENLTPSIKEALANQLEEELDDSGVEEESLEEASNSGFVEVKPKVEKKLDEANKEEDAAEEDVEAANDEEAEADAEKAEADSDENAAEEAEADAEEDEEKAEKDEEGNADSEEEPSDEDSISDLTVGQLKDMILDIIATANPTPAPESDMGADMEAADVEGAGEEDVPIEGDETLEKNSADMPAKDAEDSDEEIDLAEVLKELEEEGFLATDKRGKEHDKGVKDNNICQDREIQELKNKLAAKDKELEEVHSKVKELAENLKSVNLLNSKLLYTSRILSQKNLSLSDEQKINVIKTLDEAKSPKEVKQAYNSLCESFKDSKEVLRESRRFASRFAGNSTANNNIIPVDPTVRRMQQLAGIIE